MTAVKHTKPQSEGAAELLSWQRGIMVHPGCGCGQLPLDMTAVDTFAATTSTSCKQHVVTFKDATQIAQAHKTASHWILR